MSGFVTLSSPDGSFVKVRPSDIECIVVATGRDQIGDEFAEVSVLLKSSQAVRMGSYEVDEAIGLVSFWEKEMEKVFN